MASSTNPEMINLFVGAPLGESGKTPQSPSFVYTFRTSNICFYPEGSKAKGAREWGGGPGHGLLRSVYREADSPNNSKMRANNFGSGGRYHHCCSPIRIRLTVISNPATARSILFAVGLPSFLFFC